MEAQGGYIIPMAPGYADLEIYTGNPVPGAVPGSLLVQPQQGFAGPATRRPPTRSQYIIVNTFAQAIQSGDAAGAVQQAEAQCSASTGVRPVSPAFLAASDRRGIQAPTHNRPSRDRANVFAAEQPMSVLTAERKAAQKLSSNPGARRGSGTVRRLSRISSWSRG